MVPETVQKQINSGLRGAPKHFFTLSLFLNFLTQ